MYGAVGSKPDFLESKWVADLTDNHRWKECLNMDEKTKILISVGASMAANCVACLDHYYGKACEAGLTSEEIDEAAEIGVKVKRGAHLIVRKSLADLTGGETADESPCCGSSKASCCE